MCTWQCPSPMQAHCLLSPGPILSCPNRKQWWRTDNNNRAKKAPPLPTSNRRNKNTDKEKQGKSKEMDQAREISEHHFRGGGSCGNCKDSRAMHYTFNNYRPVSNLPFLSKILEKLVFNQVNDFFNCKQHFREVSVWL